MAVPQVIRTTTEQIYGPVLTQSSPYQWYSPYYFQLPPNLPAGTVILATSTFEVTNPYSFPVQCDRYIALGTAWGQTNAPTPMMPITCSNVTPNQHHLRDTVTAVIDDDSLAHVGLNWSTASGQWLSLIVAAASMVSAPGDFIVFEHGYGELIALIFRP